MMHVITDFTDLKLSASALSIHLVSNCHYTEYLHLCMIPCALLILQNMFPLWSHAIKYY